MESQAKKRGGRLEQAHYLFERLGVAGVLQRVAEQLASLAKCANHTDHNQHAAGRAARNRRPGCGAEPAKCRGDGGGSRRRAHRAANRFRVERGRDSLADKRRCATSSCRCTLTTNDFESGCHSGVMSNKNTALSVVYTLDKILRWEMHKVHVHKLSKWTCTRCQRTHKEVIQVCCRARNAVEKKINKQKQQC